MSDASAPPPETTPLIVSKLRAEADSEEVRALTISTASVMAQMLAAKTVPVLGLVADALIATREKLRADRLERTLLIVQEELSTLVGRVDELANDARIDAEAFDLVRDRWIESAQSARGDEHRRRLARFLKNCIAEGLRPHETDERLTFLESLDDFSEFEIAILAASFSRQYEDRVEAIKQALAELDDEELVAGVDRLRIRGYVVRSPTGASWNNPMIHPIRLTPLGERFCQFVLA